MFSQLCRLTEGGKARSLVLDEIKVEIYLIHRGKHNDFVEHWLFCKYRGGAAHSRIFNFEFKRATVVETNRWLCGVRTSFKQESFPLFTAIDMNLFQARIFSSLNCHWYESDHFGQTFSVAPPPTSWHDMSCNEMHALVNYVTPDNMWDLKSDWLGSQNQILTQCCNSLRHGLEFGDWFKKIDLDEG